jgi:thiamine biosynthesis protein ThiS
MSIIVNGKEVEYKKNESVSDLLKRMHYTFPLIVVKINGKLIKKIDYSNAIVPNESKIQVVHMISGG